VFDQKLSDNQDLTKENMDSASTIYKTMKNELKDSLFEFKNALQIMHQKGYPKDWILNSMCSIDDRPLFLEITNPKALAMSLPDYDPAKTKKQEDLFIKISERHQKKLNTLKNTIELPEQLISDLNELFFRKNYFKKDGTFLSSPQFDFYIFQVQGGEVTGNQDFDTQIQEVLSKYGDTQSTRQAICINLKRLLAEAKKKYTELQ
jgi:hypothetical protein